MKARASLQWHITHKCGNRCQHCYIQDYATKETTTPVALEIIDDFVDFSQQLEADAMLAISGGDPLLSENFWPIIHKARGLCSRVSILGNPELLNRDNLIRLKEAGIDEYQVSIDGTPDIHDAIRYPGSHQRTTKAITDLIEAGIEPVVMTTVSSVNYESMEKVMEHVYSLGVRYWAFSRWIPENGDCGIKPLDYRDFLLRMLEEHQKYAHQAQFIAKDPLYAPILGIRQKSSRIINGGCSLGCSRLVMLPDATMMSCRRHADSAIGRWDGKGSFLNAFLFHEKMLIYRDIGKIDGCGKCEFLNICRGCRAASFAKTGNPLAKDPQCWL